MLGIGYLPGLSEACVGLLLHAARSSQSVFHAMSLILSEGCIMAELLHLIGFLSAQL